MGKNMRKFRDIIFGCILAGSISTCTDLNFAGGGLDTETSGGTVVGLLAAEDGTPEINAQVFCVPSSYNALKDPQLSDTLINTTDETGCYRFDGVKKGTYNIQAVSPEKKTNILICGIDVGKDTVMVPGGTLHASGTLKIIFPDAGYDAPSYCYLPGTTFFAQIQNGLAVMNDVPAGFVPAADYFNTLDSTKNHVIQAGFFISLGDTTVIADLTAWRYSKKLYLNTTAAGANINGNVFNFPALVRLTPNNFDFTQAAAGGGDIRFAKSDNTPLTYEIERWDAGARVAEIWVKVDTIYGNDSVQSITMYWGNQNASDNSNGPVVFDTAEGFQGVWHLAQPNGSVIPDATGNGNDGTATGTTTGAGEVGMAQMFNGKSSFIRVSGPAMDKLNFPENGAFSVAAWVQTNVLDSLFHGVVYKSNEQYGLQMRPKNIWEFCTYIDNTRWELSRAFAMDYSWHALVGVRNGTKQYLYVDGVCADTSVALLSSNLARVTDQPLDIGHCPDGGTDPDRYFNGAIDEVRIASVVRSADWIKLCFMNQKVPDALVKW
jgi:hypothetical protein